ncbi:hypothetical protein M501DRAFT_1020042 [Patellaria atrata CBS 101060]|uniref:Ubiquitin 3 binding protein But2 C-terminal domain-containing protein n=1 Tax=Patellaria atrata CBS 101060 TaxID=1346257 RepID=A0A9P4S4U2_9PEZI|nr:hypothetical protein M501DRAFT_1020042 [Patellaria atrata CBS 101060]
MVKAFTPFAFALGASAAAIKRGGYGEKHCFNVYAVDGAWSALGQLDDGQVRIGGGHGVSTFCVEDGVVTDSHGRGCIVTPETSQIQCDAGAKGTPGFSCESGDLVTYHGKDCFWACPVNDFGEWNVYTEPLKGQLKCVEVRLKYAAVEASELKRREAHKQRCEEDDEECYSHHHHPEPEHCEEDDEECHLHHHHHHPEPEHCKEHDEECHSHHHHPEPEPDCEVDHHHEKCRPINCHEHPHHPHCHHEEEVVKVCCVFWVGQKDHCSCPPEGHNLFGKVGKVMKRCLGDHCEHHPPDCHHHPYLEDCKPRRPDHCDDEPDHEECRHHKPEPEALCEEDDEECHHHHHHYTPIPKVDCEKYPHHPHCPPETEIVKVCCVFWVGQKDHCGCPPEGHHLFGKVGKVMKRCLGDHCEPHPPDCHHHPYLEDCKPKRPVHCEEEPDHEDCHHYHHHPPEPDCENHPHHHMCPHPPSPPEEVEVIKICCVSWEGQKDHCSCPSKGHHLFGKVGQVQKRCLGDHCEPHPPDCHQHPFLHGCPLPPPPKPVDCEKYPHHYGCPPPMPDCHHHPHHPECHSEPEYEEVEVVKVCCVFWVGQKDHCSCPPKGHDLFGKVGMVQKRCLGDHCEPHPPDCRHHPYLEGCPKPNCDEHPHHHLCPPPPPPKPVDCEKHPYHYGCPPPKPDCKKHPHHHDCHSEPEYEDVEVIKVCCAFWVGQKDHCSCPPEGHDLFGKVGKVQKRCFGDHCEPHPPDCHHHPYLEDCPEPSPELDCEHHPHHHGCHPPKLDCHHHPHHPDCPSPPAEEEIVKVCCMFWVGQKDKCGCPPEGHHLFGKVGKVQKRCAGDDCETDCEVHPDVEDCKPKVNCDELPDHDECHNVKPKPMPPPLCEQTPDHEDCQDKHNLPLLPPHPPAPKDCPADLEGPFQFPHLIVPIDASKPHKACGTQYNGVCSATKSTIYNFDIPESYKGKTCSLIFLFPKKGHMETSDYKYNGHGSIRASVLWAPADEHTTYANAPAKKRDFGSFDIKPGHEYVLDTYPCRHGMRIGFELESEGIELEYFQDYNPEPIGLYLRQC